MKLCSGDTFDVVIHTMNTIFVFMARFAASNVSLLLIYMTYGFVDKIICQSNVSPVVVAIIAASELTPLSDHAVTEMVGWACHFDVFFDLLQNKPLNKQSWSSRALSRSLWRHCNVVAISYILSLQHPFHLWPEKTAVFLWMWSKHFRTKL